MLSSLRCCAGTFTSELTSRLMVLQRSQYPELTTTKYFASMAANPLSPEQPAFCVGYVTAPASLSDKIARHLVENKLVACVNILPAVKSVYRWEGAVETGEEQLLMLKTRWELRDAVIAAVRSVHEYTVPEVIFTPIVHGYTPYLDWIAQSTDASVAKAGEK